MRNSSENSRMTSAEIIREGLARILKPTGKIVRQRRRVVGKFGTRFAGHQLPD